MKLKVHPAIVHAQAMLNNVPDRTGKSLSEWTSIIQRAGLSEGRGVINFLKTEYGLGRPTGMVIASYALDNKDDFDPDVYLAHAPKIIEAQYVGKKAHLRPLADQIFSLIGALGEDVDASPCKTYVPFYRKHVFAQVKAASQKRIDVGVALGAFDEDIPAFLKDTGGKAKGDRITHAVAVTDLHDINDDLAHWVRVAYQLDVA